MLGKGTIEGFTKNSEASQVFSGILKSTSIVLYSVIFLRVPTSFCGTFTELLNSSCECWGEVLDGMDVPSREYLALNIGLDTILRSVEDILILKVKFPSFCLNSEKLEMAMHTN